MRNLKKVLSLTLALVMLIGMMVVGAGATSFKDDKDIADEYKVAAAVLDKIGVMKGTELNGETNFNPKKSLTRVEGAALIYRLVTGGLSMNPSGESGFTDVDGTPNHGWASGTVAACRDLGIVSGESATTFNPGGELTVSAFAKMLLVTLGYEDKYAGYSGEKWETNVARDARARGILLNGLTMNAKLTREQAAQMAFQALTAEMVEYTGMNVTIGDTALNSPATVRLHSSDKFGETTYTNVPATATTPIRLCEERFPDLKLAKTVDDETFGRTLSVWTWKRVEIGGTETNVTPDAVFTAETNENGAKAAIGKAVGTADLYMNGNLSRQYISAKVIADELAENGRLVEVYLAETDKTKVEKVVVVDTALGEITKVDSKNEKITIKLAGSDVVLGSPNLTTKVGYGEFEKGDMVVVTGYNAWNSGNDKFYNDGKVQTTVDTVAEATVVTGLAKFKDNKNCTITIDGTAYEMAVGLVGGQEESFESFKLHKTKDSTLYLYELGGVEYVIKAVPGEDVKGPADNLIAVSSAYQSLVNGRIVNMVDGVLSNGQKVTWQTNILATPSTNGPMYRWDDDDSDGIYVLNAINADADVTSVATTGAKLYYLSKQGTLSKVSFSSTAIRPATVTGMTNYMYADDVKFIFVDADNTKGTADITVMNGQQSVDYEGKTAKDTLAYAVRKAESGNYEITAVFMTNAPDVSDISDIIYVHKENPDNDQWVETTDGNKIYYGYVAYNSNGELIEGFRGDKDAMSNKFIQSKINEYEGYPMSKVNPKGTAIGKLTNANGLGGNAFILSGSNKGYYTNTDTKVVDLTGKGLDSIKEINKAFNNKTYRTIEVALIYTGKTDFVAKTVFVYNVDVKETGAPAGDSEVSGEILVDLDGANSQVTFVSAKPTTTKEKCDAIVAKLAEDGVSATVTYMGGGTYRVQIGENVKDYNETGSAMIGGVPSDKMVYDLAVDFAESLRAAAEAPGASDAQKNAYREALELVELSGSGLLSSGAKVTPTTSTAATISNIDWRTDLNVQVPGYGKDFNKTLIGMYGDATVGSDGTTNARQDVREATHWALVSINNAANDDCTIYFLIKTAGGDIKSVTRAANGAVSTTAASTITVGSVTYTITGPSA